MVNRLVESFLTVYKIPESELRLIDSGVRENWFLLAGRLLCRLDLLIPLGHFFASVGVKKSYGRLTQLVLDIKAGLANLP